MDERVQAALRTSLEALDRVANYRLSPALNKRMLDLGERKEFLGPEEHNELLALVAFSQQRSVEMLEARTAIKRLREAFPDLVNVP